MQIYIMILIAVLIYFAIRPSMDTEEFESGDANAFRSPDNCDYTLTIPPYVQQPDPLIAGNSNPWDRPTHDHCRSDSQCQSGKCDKYFCT